MSSFPSLFSFFILPVFLYIILSLLFALSLCLSLMMSEDNITVIFHNKNLKFRLFLTPFFTQAYISLPQPMSQLFPLFRLSVSFYNQPNCNPSPLFCESLPFFVPSVLFPLQIIYFINLIFESKDYSSFHCSLILSLALISLNQPSVSLNCQHQSSWSSHSYQACSRFPVLVCSAT